MVNKGILIYDPGFVEPYESLLCHQTAIPARELSAEHFGKELSANMILYVYLIQKLNGKIDRKRHWKRWNKGYHAHWKKTKRHLNWDFLLKHKQNCCYFKE